MTSSPRRRAIAAIALPLALLASLLVAGPVAASAPAGFDPSDPPPPDTNPPGRSTEATIIDFVNTSGLFGGTVPAAEAQTPYPTTGLQDLRTVETAQIVLDDPSVPGEQRLYTYCIDLDTQTTIGVHYELGEWTDANVPNLPYVQWILDHYFPTVPTAPAGTDTEKTRAVQGAIWYFTDRFVVSPAYPTERAAVAAIVAAAQAALAGPTPPAPVTPTLTVTPPTLEGVFPGQLVGPFLVGGSVADAVVTVADDTLVFRDAGGGDPVFTGDTVAVGSPLWVQYVPDVEDQGFVLEASATVTAGTVFLYDGQNPPRRSAQKLVLAASSPVTLRAAASVVPEVTGSLEVTADIAGAGAGSQGAVALEVACEWAEADWRRTWDFTVPAGWSGPAVFAIADVPGGSTCVLRQTADGVTPEVTLVGTEFRPADATAEIVGDETAQLEVIDTYDLVSGSLEVYLSLSGAAAGRQGRIGIEVVCTDGGSTLGPFDFLVPARRGAGTGLVTTVADLPAGSECTLTQTASGANARASLTSSTIVPQPALITPGAAATITLANVYAIPTPTPTPTPSPTVTPTPTVGPVPPLPPTGGTAPWAAVIAGAGALMAGSAILAAAVRRRRSARPGTGAGPAT